MEAGVIPSTLKAAAIVAGRSLFNTNLTS